MNVQPIHLKTDHILLKPLEESDFDMLYEVASDPLIWEQHPNPDRYKRDVFETYFKGAMESQGAFLIQDANTSEVLGCTRFYDRIKDEIKIGYTFYGRSSWGKGINAQVKKLMLAYAFQFVEHVVFHVGANNIRSQKAMEKIGAIKTGEEEVAYFGEASRLNFVYTISKNQL